MLFLKSPNINLWYGLKWFFPQEIMQLTFKKSLKNWHGTQCRPKLNPNCTLKQPTWSLIKLSQSDLQPWRVIWRLSWNPGGFWGVLIENSMLVTFGRPYFSLRISLTVSCFELGWSMVEPSQYQLNMAPNKLWKISWKFSMSPVAEWLMTLGTGWLYWNCWLSTKLFNLPGPKGAHLGSKLGSRLVCFGGARPLQTYHSVLRYFFFTYRSKGCPFRFQVGFQAGLQTYHTVLR